MALSNRLNRSRRRSRSRSRSPLERGSFKKCDEPRQIANNEQSRLSSVLLKYIKFSSLFRSRTTSKPRSHFIEGSELIDMDLGPTIVDPFYPLIYDGIRPAKIRSRFEARHDQPTSSIIASKVKVIPIQLEHHDVHNTSVVENNPGRDTCASLIVVDDVSEYLVEPTRSEQGNTNKDILQSKQDKSSDLIGNTVCKSGETATDSVHTHKVLKSKHSWKEDTIDLSETSSVEDGFLQSKGQTAIAIPKSKWTEIPIHHIKDSSKVSTQPNLSESGENVSSITCAKQSKSEVNTRHPSMFPKEENQSSNQNIVSARGDLHSQPKKTDPLSLNVFKKAFTSLQQLSDLSALSPHMAPGEHVLKEQEVNPTPSYPVYEQLKSQLSKENRMIDYIRGDGNCFFRTLSKHLYCTEKYHKALRSLTVDIMATNRSFFVQFIDGGNVQAHIEQMSEESTWATTCEIYAAATLLQREIYMLTPDHSNTRYNWLLFEPLFKLPSLCPGHGLTSLPDNKNLEDPCYLTVCNTNGNHYDRVVPDHGGCNCFLPAPHLEGVSGSVVID